MKKQVSRSFIDSELEIKGTAEANAKVEEDLLEEELTLEEAKARIQTELGSEEDSDADS